jgi:hypothetical protein
MIKKTSELPDDFVDYELEVVENEGNENRIKCESGVAR